jgi:hypothetical protein
MPESVTPKVSARDFAAAVGVPLITPVEAFSERPLGSAPEVNAQLYGAVPPLAVRVAVYAAPTLALGKALVAIDKGATPAGRIVENRLADLVWAGLLESVTVNVRATWFATALGVPATTPVVGFSERPAGSVPDVSVQV